MILLVITLGQEYQGMSSSSNDLVDDLVGDYMRSVISVDAISSNNDHKGWF